MANQVTDRITVGIPGGIGQTGPRGPQGVEGPEGPRGPAGPAGEGSINSVNGQTGPDIFLTANDVGAVPLSQFATVNQRGTIQILANSDVGGTDSTKAITSAGLRTHLSSMYEKTATSVTGLGDGSYVGQFALVTLSPGTQRFGVVWTGVRWEPISWRMSGTTQQRTTFTNQGLAYDGIKWFDTTTQSEWTRRAGAWYEEFKSGWVEVKTGSLTAVGQNYGATLNVAVPYICKAGERILLTPSEIGTGYGNAAQNGVGTVSNGKTVISARFTQLGNATAQTVKFFWQVVKD